MKNETLSVAGMSCAHCKAKVEGKVGEISGASAEADVERGTVTLAYDETSVSRAEIETAIREVGYAVES